MELNFLLGIASHRPDKTVLIIDDENITYGMLDKMADVYARTLLGMGVTSGDRAAFFMNNRKELAALYLACFRTGIIAVPTSCYSKRPEVAYEMNHCKAKVLVAEPELFDSVADIAVEIPSLLGVFMIGGEPEDPAMSWAAATEKALPQLPEFSPEPDDPAVILYTSGSTGRPKGVTHTYASLHNSTVNRCKALEHDSDDVYFISSFLCHGSALTSAFLTMCSVGGTTVLTRHWSETGFLALMNRCRPTVVACAPTQLQKVLDHPDLCTDDFSSLRYLHVGGDAVPDSLYEQCFKKTGVDLAVALGMTECGGYMISPLHGERRWGTMGKPIPNTQVQLVDTAGNAVKDGEIGQIIIETGAMMQGYWNDPKNTSDAIRAGWLYSGDLAVRDNSGFYRFVGRCKHIIIRDTGNVAPMEVENSMEEHHKVKKCAVTGVPDGDHGQAVLAFVVPLSKDDPPTEQELSDYALEHLAERKIPKRWIFVDSVPLTSLAKIDRKQLALMAEKISKKR